MAKTRQKDLIVAYQIMGLSCKEIAEKTGFAIEYVRNICSNSSNSLAIDIPIHPEGTCKYCGKILQSTHGKKKKSFCDSVCRDHYFNQRKKRTPYILTCEYCGNEFVAYGNPKKRFCSDDCRILAGGRGE